MDPVFKKLNFKEEENICVLDAPAAFEPHLEAMREFTGIDRAPAAGRTYHFVLAFARQMTEMGAIAELLNGRLKTDPLLWIAYPKRSSKKYISDIGRDDPGWRVLGERGFEGVRQVAIDADWSALRFRQVDFIKSMKRDASRALSDKGKKRTS